MMTSSWVMDEMQSVDLRDLRLERRLVQLLDTLSQSASASIPAACRNRAEMVAAYRFFDNDKVDFDDVLSPHIDATYERVQEQPVALLVQDTTELDLTRPTSRMQGVGPLQHGHRSGALLHLLHAFTPDGTPLGTLAAKAWARAQPATNQTKRGSSEKRVQCARKPFHQKETHRWLATSQHCTEIKRHTPDTQLIMLADRESDITDVIDYCHKQDQFDWIIRGDGDRVLHRESTSETSVRVHDHLSRTKPLYRDTLTIRARLSWGSQSIKHRPGKADRLARDVKVSVHAGALTLNDPRPEHRDGVTVGVLLVREEKPSNQHEPIEWVLLTSLPIKTRQQAQQVIAYYLQRWMIELYFKVLKSGCQIESRRFEHIDRYLPALALYMIIAWRTLYVCRVSRTHAECSCELVYAEAEWKGVWQVVRGRRPPRKPPPLLEMTKIVAELGGYIHTRRARPPGPQSIWLGLQQLHLIATCWLTFGPGAKTKCV
jgi:hypothetical protein